MSPKLPAVNRYLRSGATRRRAVLVSVASSSAIEGIRAPLGAIRTTVRSAPKATARKAGARKGQRVTALKFRRSSAKSGS